VHVISYPLNSVDPPARVSMVEGGGAYRLLLCPELQVVV
jgi:hypothetical protein